MHRVGTQLSPSVWLATYALRRQNGIFHISVFSSRCVSQRTHID